MISRNIFIFLSVVSLINPLAAQTDSLSVLRKTKRNWTGLRLGIEATPATYSFLKQNYLGHGGSLETIFGKKWILASDVGIADYSYKGLSNRHSVRTKGLFFSVGLDYNLLDSPEDMVLIGVRFGRAVFGQQVDYLTADTVWTNQPFASITVNNLSATWAELAAGLRVRVWGNLYIGTTTKAKARLYTSNPKEMTIATVPGFGSAGVTLKTSYQLSIYYFFKRKNR